MGSLTVGDWLKIVSLVVGLAGTVLTGYLSLKEFDHEIERRVDRLEYMQGIVTDGDT